MSIESRTKLTYEDYLGFPDDGRRHEIIDGEHIVTPAPGTYHQTLSKRLQFQLYAQIEERGLGLVFYAPIDVQLSNVDIVQPDLIVLLGARKDLVTPSRIQGSPDVVVEILSESTQRSDRQLKMDAYRRGAVPEYWIVDPDRKVVEVHLLEAGAYRLAEECRDEIVFRRLEGVGIDLKKVW